MRAGQKQPKSRLELETNLQTCKKKNKEKDTVKWSAETEMGKQRTGRRESSRTKTR